MDLEVSEHGVGELADHHRLERTGDSDK